MATQAAKKKIASPRRKAKGHKASRPRSISATPKTSEVAEERYLIREVEPRDLDGLHALSKHLNSVNFPHNKKVLRNLIEDARQSSSGKVLDVFRRQYMFVMEGQSSHHLAGTSMIFAQHGHPESPHIFFDVIEDERYSSTLDRHFKHLFLRLGFNYAGPSEIGALVLDPKLRSFGLGKPLSFVRFLFMGMYRAYFRDSVIAELMPPLLSDGRSRLWEHIGRRFTGLSYQEADKLSHANKEFISSLFPQDIQASLLPEDIIEIIGQVGEDTKGVKKMLESVGFEYSHRIDPFDGGPHFECATDDITAVRNTKRFRLAKDPLDDSLEVQILGRQTVPGVQRVLIGAGAEEPPFKFRAIVGAARYEGDDVEISKDTRAVLKLRTGAPVWTLPL